MLAAIEERRAEPACSASVVSASSSVAYTVGFSTLKTGRNDHARSFASLGTSDISCYISTEMGYQIPVGADDRYWTPASAIDLQHGLQRSAWQ